MPLTSAPRTPAAPHSEQCQALASASQRQKWLAASCRACVAAPCSRSLLVSLVAATRCTGRLLCEAWGSGGENSLRLLAQALNEEGLPEPGARRAATSPESYGALDAGWVGISETMEAPRRAPACHLCLPPLPATSACHPYNPSIRLGPPAGFSAAADAAAHASPVLPQTAEA